jgi:hypothetical protein
LGPFVVFEVLLHPSYVFKNFHNFNFVHASKQCLLSFVKKSWVFNTHSCRRRSRFSEAKNLAVHIFGNIL